MHWICKLRIPRISKDGKMDHLANKELCKCSSTSQICKLIEDWFEPSNWRWFDGSSCKQNEKSNSQMRLIYYLIGHIEHLKLHLFTIHTTNQWRVRGRGVNTKITMKYSCTNICPFYCLNNRRNIGLQWY
jgi:hypothetical protein